MPFSIQPLRLLQGLSLIAVRYVTWKLFDSELERTPESLDPFAPSDLLKAGASVPTSLFNFSTVFKHPSRCAASHGGALNGGHGGILYLPD